MAQFIKISSKRPQPTLFASGCVLTIGAFDGLHKGHQTIISSLNQWAKESHLPSAVLSFRPDPAEFFNAGKNCNLMSWREKAQRIEALGVNAVLSMRFDLAVSQMSAESFVTDILIERLNVKKLMVGDDFRFGLKRSGDYTLLQKMSASCDFEVVQSPTHMLEQQRMSSTWVRALLAESNFSKAAVLLGAPYQICGKVIKGKQLGRTLGYPTANIALHRKQPSIRGVFAVEVLLNDGQRCLGVANLGTRPAVNSLEQPILEVYLLDYKGDLYGQRIAVDFHHKIRDEVNFSGLASLKQAIAKDEKQARHWFASNPPAKLL